MPAGGNMRKVYLIQGFFFQNHQSIGLGSVDGHGLGAVVRTDLMRFMFAGVIFPDPDDDEKMVGQMTDHFGQSILYNVGILPDKLLYTKKYDGRRDTIEYTFKREGDQWVGGYSGTDTGSGAAKCVLTAVSDDFFRPPE